MTAQFSKISYATIRAKVDNQYLDVIKFKDPWLRDYNQTPFGIRNRGVSAQHINLANSNNNLSLYSQHQGVLLNQSYNDLTKPYYSINMPQTINIFGNSHKLYLLNWSASGATLQNPNSLNTGVVFTSTNGANITANIKGSLLSDNNNAYKNSSQRKFVSHYGRLVTVYESMGKVWLESSKDNGITWDLLNNRQPINLGAIAKNPSLCLIPGRDEVGVVYQEGSKIELTIISSENRTTCINVTQRLTVENTSGLTNANPVISCKYIVEDEDLMRSARAIIERVYMVAWSKNSSTSPGLYYRLIKEDYGSNFSFLTNSRKISNTNGYSYNPTLTSLQMNTDFHLAWEQYINYYHTEIRYVKLFHSKPNNSYFYNYSVPSNGSGCPRNQKPSIVVMNSNAINLCWVGDNFGSGADKRVLKRHKAYSTWSNSFGNYGMFVTSVNVNANNSLTKCAFAWVEEISPMEDPVIAVHNYYKKENASNIGSLGTDGTSLQICNGNNLYALSFKNNVVPKHFKISSLGSLAKSSSKNHSGIQTVLKADNVEFYCRLSDVENNGNLIEFKSLSKKDTVSINKNKDFRTIETEEIKITDKADIFFTLNYGTTNAIKAKDKLRKDDFVKFKLAIIDALNNKELASLKEIIINNSLKSNCYEKSYRVNTKDLIGKSIKIQIIPEITAPAEQTFGEFEADKPFSNTLKKENFYVEKLKIELEKITKYSLSQNYPNPFNPITNITYTLPKDGFVELKVYDILGKEVSSLVSEYKTNGRYNVIFDGSRLSSGIYFYQIKVNDFIDSKKFILMK